MKNTCKWNKWRLMFSKNILFLSKERIRVSSAEICSVFMLAWKSVLFFDFSLTSFWKKNSMVASDCLNLTTGFLSRQTTVKLNMYGMQVFNIKHQVFRKCCSNWPKIRISRWEQTRRDNSKKGFFSYKRSVL